MNPLERVFVHVARSQRDSVLGGAKASERIGKKLAGGNEKVSSVFGLMGGLAGAVAPAQLLSPKKIIESATMTEAELDREADQINHEI